MNPSVSIIIATYNFEKFLKETIESVFQQTFQDWELIIVDDGSTDKTSEIVKPYLLDKRVRYIFQPNRGLPAARNVGLGASSGKYIQFLDADDLIHPEKLKKQAQFLDSHPEIDGVICQHRFFKTNVSNSTMSHGFSKVRNDIKRELLKGNFIVVNAPLVRKSAVERVGSFDESLTSTEDWDLWLRLSLSGSVFEPLEEELAYVRLNESRMTCDTANLYVGRYKVIQRTLKLIPKTSPYWKQARDCYVRSKLALARIYAARGEMKKAGIVLGEEPRCFSLRGVMEFLMESISDLRSRMRPFSSPRE